MSGRAFNRLGAWPDRLDFMTGVRHVLELLEALDRQESPFDEDAPDKPVISSATMLQALIDNDFDLSSAIVSTCHAA